jgi:chromosome segregation ATPase
MSMTGSEDMANAGEWDDEVLEILADLDAANEHYMVVNVELRDLLEEAVTREVGLEKRVDALVAEVASGVAEMDTLRVVLDAARADNAGLHREAADLRAQLGRLDAELTALHNTKLMRAAAPFRSLYARIRRRHG